MLERRRDGPSLGDIMGRRELAGRRGEGQLSRRELLRKALLAGVVVWGIEAAALAYVRALSNAERRVVAAAEEPPVQAAEAELSPTP